MINAEKLSCGSCTLCCKIMDVVELNKPAGRWCEHCKPGIGCGNYENRFDVCKTFECLWLHSQKPTVDAKLRFSVDMRPDKSHVILNKKPDGKMFAHVPEDRPDAWKNGKMGEWLKRENAVRPVTIVCGTKQFAMP